MTASLPLGGEYCEQLEEAEWNGETMRAGDVVRTLGHVAVVGTICALYVERHPNVGGPRVFAELSVRGDHQRIWFDRDRPEPYALGIEVDQPAEGMLW